MNCKVIVEYDSYASGYNERFIADEGMLHNEYHFDDVRVAVAIANLLDNIENVEKSWDFIPKENTDND